MIDVVDMIDPWEARQVRQIRLALGQSWLGSLGRLGACQSFAFRNPQPASVR